ncbi:MAG: hypothetical protein HKP30_11020 [Myxococcales bacterium]|nr:hypothetical protein [Myxococcales bacterium]
MRVGADVEAICGPCGETWHVVVAVAPGRPAQVECKECGARHRYRPVGGTPTAPRRSARATGRSARKPAAPLVEADLSKPVRSFRTTDTYAAGERVQHASFGAGVVQAVKGPGKVEIHFEAGPKVLVHGRPLRGDADEADSA